MFPATDSDHPLARFLHRKIFWCRDLPHFRAQYVDDVDPEGFSEDAALGCEQHEYQGSKIKVWSMPGGVSVAWARGPEGTMWAAFETLERVAHRKQLARWATFARGHWTLQCPTEPGIYPVCARSAGVPSALPFTVPIEFQTRKLARVEGVVRDVSEFTPTTHRTLWRGYWWSEPLPPMLAPTLGT